MESEIISFFEQHIKNLRGDGSSGQNPNTPKFELLPRDFVEFAEIDLRADNSIHSLVNATSNLKRAVDCQLDYILCALNLDNIFRQKRLGVDRKLGLLKKAGIFRSRSIEKLNTLRNRLEHHYEMPEIEDVEVYFDLVGAFVSVGEAVLPALGYGASLSMRLIDDGYVYSEFEHQGPSLTLELIHKPSAFSKQFKVDISNSTDIISDLDLFAFLLRVHISLRKLDEKSIGDRHFMSSIKGNSKI